MNIFSDRGMLWLISEVAGLLLLSTGIGLAMKRMVTTEPATATVANLNTRIRAWWIMFATFSLSLVIGKIGTVILFGLISFLALREFITLIPTRRSDHLTLLCVFYMMAPLQYLLVGMQWYTLFSVLIPLHAFLLIPILSVISGDSTAFFERIAKIQWGLMICVYCVSHVPALLGLKIPGYEDQNAKLLCFFVIVVQISDVLQYVWGKLFGKRKIAPNISPNKTLEGFIGGVCCATLIGTLLWWATPFSPWQAAGVSFAITLAGFAGGLTMSAIKRDCGVKDFGTIIKGHGGVLDRIDSICFAAPVFYHLIKHVLA